MGNLYLECTISDLSKLDSKLVSWDISRQFSNIFGEVFTTTLSSEKLGNTFYIQIKGEEIEGMDMITTLKVNKILDNLKGSLSKVDLIQETPDLIVLFENIAQSKNNSSKARVINEDSGLIKTTFSCLFEKNKRQENSPTGVDDELTEEDRPTSGPMR